MQVLLPGLPLQLFEQHSLLLVQAVPEAEQLGGGGGVPPIVEFGGRLEPRFEITASMGTPRFGQFAQWWSEITA